MNRAAVSIVANPSAPRILLLLSLLLPYWISGTECYRIEVPAQYTALQGHLTATVYLTQSAPASDRPIYVWDPHNNTFVRKSSSLGPPELNSSDELDFGGYNSPEDNIVSPGYLEDYPEPDDPLPVVAISREDYAPDPFGDPPLTRESESPASALSLSLFANGSQTPIETLPVTEAFNKKSYVFPCGLVVHGGIHFFKLTRGDETLALSSDVNVAWPEISLEVPSEVETYHTSVQVILRFTGNLCKPTRSVTFHAWIDLLYHGVPVGMGNSLSSKRCGNPDPKRSWNRTLWNSYQDDRNRRALRKFRKGFLGKKKKGRRKNGKRRKQTKKGKNGRKNDRRKSKKHNQVEEFDDTEERTDLLLDVDDEINTDLNDIEESSTSGVITNTSNVALASGPSVGKKGNVSVAHGKRKRKRRKKGRSKVSETEEGMFEAKDLSNSSNSSVREMDRKNTTGKRRRKKKGRRRKTMRNSSEVDIEEADFEPVILNTTVKGNEIKSPKILPDDDDIFSEKSLDIDELNKFSNKPEDEFSIESSSLTPLTSDFEDGLDFDEVTPGSLDPDYLDVDSESRVRNPSDQSSSSQDIFHGDSGDVNLEQQAERLNDTTVVPESPSDMKKSSSVKPDSVTERSSFDPLIYTDEDELSSERNTKPEFDIDYSLPMDLFSSKEAEAQVSREQSDIFDMYESDRNYDIPLSEDLSESYEAMPHRKKRDTTQGDRFLRSMYLKRPPQAAIVSSGSRGRGWAWGGKAAIFGRVPLEKSLYAVETREIKFPCTDIGPAGIYSVRLSTNVSSNSVIINSKLFEVNWSKSFSVHVHAASIIPCRGSIGVQVTYPTCIGGNDKVRVYARIRANVTSANPPIVDKYMAETRIIRGHPSVQFPCDTFNNYATEFCFFYVNTAKTGAVSNVDKCCVPTYKRDVIQQNGQWGEWTSWTTCTSTCGIGERLRHRFCDSPPPRSGGKYCKGESIESQPCEVAECVEPSLYPPPASTPGGERCSCGCTLELTSGSAINITASAAECNGIAVWLLQAPEGERVMAEVTWAVLRPGAQWLKLRDGDSLSSPLLVRLPSPVKSSESSPSPRRLSRAPRQSSSGSNLILEFRSDVNVTSATVNPAAWGFLVTVHPASEVLVSSSESKPEGAQKGTYWRLLAGMHVAAVVFTSALVAAVIVLAVYNWRRYRLYKRAKLIPESPYITPPGTPSREVATGSSTLTLTEVISLKSMVFKPKIPLSLPLRRKGSSSSYSTLDDRQPEEPRHSLPNSPFLTRRAVTPSTIRRSSSQLGRFLRKGNGNFKKKKRRRFGSVDELEIRCISPIHETHKEDEGGGKEETSENANKNDEEESAKYKEYRKSLIANEMKDLRLPHKLVKDKMNLERVRRSAISRSNSNATMRAASSVSELSVNGTDTDMEYDYYDYDMDNASAVPGSLFGLDPLLLAWVPPFIPMSGECTPPNEGIPLDVIFNSSHNDDETDATTPKAEQPDRPNVLPLEHMNIPPTDPPQNTMESSIRSEEANDRVELQAKPPKEEPSPPCEDDDRTPTTDLGSKILNLDDFQFADDTDDDDCDL